MRPMNMKNAISKTQLLLTLMVAVALMSVTAFAAAPGITSTGNNFVRAALGSRKSAEPKPVSA